MSLPMNSVFESLFRLDPIISGITMAPILEETNGNGNKKEGTKLFKKNSTGSIGSASGSINKYNSSNGNGSSSTPPPGRFERSGSTKSYAKNRSPLSRLWQMRRRSFSQFELSSISLSAGNVVAGIGKGSSSHHYSHLNEIDLDDAGAPGFFQLIGDHWNSETDLTSKGSQRVSTTSSDDYGFLPHPHVRPPPKANDPPLTVSLVDDGRSNACCKDRISSVSDFEEEDGEDLEEHNLGDRRISARSASGSGTCTSGGSKRSSKLKRRKAYYREKKEGRSRSLTHIDNLDPAMLLRNEEMDSKSEPDTSHDQLLFVPQTPETRESRRKKLARSQVSSSEFFSVCFEGVLGAGLEEFLPASRGTCLGDALRPLFEKKNISLSSVNVFVDSSKTPLPAPAHTDTYFVAGKNLIVRAKTDGKFHSRSFKQPSRKSSQRGKHKFFSASTEDPSYSGTVDPLLSSTSNLSSSAPHSQQPHSAHGPSGTASSPSTSASTANTNANQQPHSLLSSSLSAGAQSQQQHQPSGFISHEGSLKVKNTKQSTRWSGLFSNSIKDNSKMDLLVEQLNNYGKNGIPRPNILPCDTDDIESNYSVDEDWKAVVSGWNEMSERSKQQQTAIWELVETEVVYLKTIKVITDLFLACLYNLQAANILNEIDRDQLFSNIPEIYKANKALWLDCIQPIVQKARDSKQPLQPSELRSGFLKFGSTCQPYTRYCLDQTKCQQYCREKYQDNEFFKAYLAWCETRKECNRLRLMDILVRPMQRMTKYSLLLKAILKHTEDMDQRKCLEEMIGSVERFVKSVNGALRSRQDAERLQGIAERIECYDVVETKDEELEAVIKCHSKLVLFHPMPACGPKQRWLSFEGDLKIKDSFTSKMDVHCFLFTDMLLVCKPMGRKGEKMKVIRQPYVVDRLLTREFSKDPCALGLVYLNEYGTASAALTFHSNEPKLVKSWLEHIRKAQKLYVEAKGKVHENVDFTGEALEEEETGGMIYLSSRSPRGGSSRASQLSSLVHSHSSGSIEMNEVSAISTRAISFEQELRGSSLSSDDGNGNDASTMVASGIGGSLGKARSLSIETGLLRPPSPRLDRRLFMSKSPTPNTLSVQIPVPNLSGQSLPNLTSASDSSPPTYSHHSLTVPKSLLSPNQRGISYPPPSPRSLRRSHALLTSRNPPLQKSKNIISPEKCLNATLDVQVPEIRGVTPPSNDASPCASSPKGSSFSPSPEPCDKEYPSPEDDDVQIVHSNPDRGSDIGAGASINIGATSGIAKRLARNERSDTKRYYTAGAIEDIKKENSRDKDAAIHKRLSWNYGPQSQQQQLATEAAALRNRQFFSCESMVSVRSSSGVSSTSSLLHCISDLETTHEMPECGGHVSSHPQCPSSPRLRHHPDVLIAVSEPDPDEESYLRDNSQYHQYRQQKYHPSENFIITTGSDNLGFEDDSIEKPSSPRGTYDEHRRRTEMIGRHNSSTDSGATTDDSNSAGGSCPTSGINNTTKVNLLDFILSDASIEASEV